MKERMNLGLLDWIAVRPRTHLMLAIFGLAGMAFAEDFTFNWPQAFPDTGDPITYRDGNGRVRLEITLFYTNKTVSTSSEKKWCVDDIHAYPDEGGKITITGEPMTFVMPKAQSDIYLHTNNCTLEFRNVVSNRTIYVRYSGPVSTTSAINWYGGTSFLTTSWKRIAENANLADYEPITEATQTTPDGSAIESAQWNNRGNTMTPENFVRGPGWAKFQYANHGANVSKTVCVELKQEKDGIYARVPKCWAVWKMSENFRQGTDVDALDIFDNGCGGYKQSWGHFTNVGTGKGYGINRVVLNARPPATVRYGNKTCFTANATAMSGARIEFAGNDTDGRFENQNGFGMIPYELDSQISFVDATAEVSPGNAFNRRGKYVFERTKPGESTVTLSAQTQNAMMSGGRFVVRGTDDGLGRMILKVTNSKTMPVSNNMVRVEKGGELFLDYNTSGVADWAYRIIVCGGGTLRQSGGIQTFIKGCDGNRIVADSGKLYFGCDGTAPYIYHVMLKNGAEMNAGSPNIPVILKGGNGYMIRTCGGSPSTNNVSVEIMSDGNYTITTNVFSVLKTEDGTFAADFVQKADILDYHGSAGYKCARFMKTGDGVMLLEGSFSSKNEAIIEKGTLKFAGNCVWTNIAANVAAPLVLAGGDLAVAEGKAMVVGRLSRLTADAQIVLGSNATLAFQDSSADATGWKPGARLSIVAPEGSYVQFGSGKGGLAQSQITAIRLNGKPVTIGSTGRIVPRGTVFVLR